MSKTVIVSVIYEEPEWQQTKEAIQACNVPVVYVDRSGVGSLAKAYNTGFKEARKLHDFEYVWFVTNVIFEPSILPKLVQAMEISYAAAIHASFPSDHKHLRPTGEDWVIEIPYIEFTAPIVRADVFDKFKLDEKMPYWGHDLDWSYRVKKAGYQLGVHYGVELGHEYIRNLATTTKHPVTIARHKLRKNSNGFTLKRLQQLYGAGNTWRQTLGYVR